MPFLMFWGTHGVVTVRRGISMARVAPISIASASSTVTSLCPPLPSAMEVVVVSRPSSTFLWPRPSLGQLAFVGCLSGPLHTAWDERGELWSALETRGSGSAHHSMLPHLIFSGQSLFTPSNGLDVFIVQNKHPILNFHPLEQKQLLSRGWNASKYLCSRKLNGWNLHLAVCHSETQ